MRKVGGQRPGTEGAELEWGRWAGSWGLQMFMGTPEGEEVQPCGMAAPFLAPSPHPGNPGLPGVLRPGQGVTR